jgi:hypothetical protein
METNWGLLGVIGVCLRSRYVAKVSDPLPMIWLGDR